MKTDGVVISNNRTYMTLSEEKHTVEREELTCPGCAREHPGFSVTERRTNSKDRFVSHRCCGYMGNLMVCRHPDGLSTEKERGYSHCLNPRHCRPGSHGNITIVITCLCGAEKKQNVNDGWAEPMIPNWRLPAET